MFFFFFWAKQKTCQKTHLQKMVIEVMQRLGERGGWSFWEAWEYPFEKVWNFSRFEDKWCFLCILQGTRNSPQRKPFEGRNWSWQLNFESKCLEYKNRLWYFDNFFLKFDVSLFKWFWNIEKWVNEKMDNHLKNAITYYKRKLSKFSCQKNHFSIQKFNQKRCVKTTLLLLGTKSKKLVEWHILIWIIVEIRP